MEQCNAIEMKNKHVNVVSSWEEEAFAEDSMGPLGGFIWPPRSYFCNFCSREFKSAQALGGHMNVHRRDRAKLHQSQQSQTSEISTRKLGQLTMLKCNDDDDEEEKEEEEEEIIGLSNKKPRKDGVPSLRIFQKLCSSDGFVDLKKKKKSSMEEIDLELRLGDPDPAVK